MIYVKDGKTSELIISIMCMDLTANRLERTMVQLPQVTTTAADLNRNFGLWQDRAMSEPILVTHHGRPRSVLVSAEDYRRLGAD